ncbi:MAG: eukaryotic-like serine/threonine-protein kinase [Actinomycetota bacterium]|jgi:serine/threonine-protein kinase|nr:eukaryotic-like serine/threonine-protein kinase [Actinomycetota bacterium]
MHPGELIQERYALEEPIGRGGMAEVWRAHDQRLERPVAIKFLAPGFSEDPEFLVRLFNEARSVAAISNPHVTHVLDYGSTDTGPYLVMEYVSGGSLCDLTGSPLGSERAIQIMVQVAAGAGAAHERGIVHRDIKPGNILLCEDGTVKLADFGIASSETAINLTATGAAIGSAHYISPEQAMGQHATPAADVYSMGVVLYELLTGCLPFEGGNATAIAIAHVEGEVRPPSTLVADLDPRLEAVVMRCLAKSPEERFTDGNELAAALDGITHETGSTALSPEPTAVGALIDDQATEPQGAVASTGARARWAAASRSNVAKKAGAALAVAFLLVAIVLHLTSQPSVAGPRPKSNQPVHKHHTIPKKPSPSAPATTTSMGAVAPSPTPTPTPSASAKSGPRTTRHRPKPKSSPSPTTQTTPQPSATEAPSPSPSPTATPSPSPSPSAVATPAG